MNPGILKSLTPFKISIFILLTLVFFLIFGIFSVEIRDPDFWWHLKSGQHIYESGSIPVTDPFAYTSLPKDPINPESKRIKFILSQYWLSQLVFYKIYDLFNFEGIIRLRALLLTLLIFFTYRAVRREGIGIALSLMLLVPLVMIIRTYTGERPQLFSFLFSFLLIYLIEGFRKASGSTRQGSRLGRVAGATRGQGFQDSREVQQPVVAVRLWPAALYLIPIPLIMLLWANLHGGFILGILIVVAYLFAEWTKFFTKKLGNAMPVSRMKLLTATGVFAILLSLVNPNGYNVIAFLIEFERGQYKEMIIESMPPLTLVQAGFYSPQFIIYFVILSLCALLFIVNIRKVSLTDVLLTVGLALMSLSASRFIPFFAPVAILMIARYGAGMLDNLPKRDLFDRVREKGQLPLSIILSIALVVIINSSDLFKEGVRMNKFPSGAATFLKENRIEGNMFNPYVWGGYLIWSLYPDYRVFIDGRGLIGEVFFQQVTIMEANPKKIEGMPQWKAMLKAYTIDYIITYSVGNFTGRLVPLIPALLNDEEWHLVYMDNISLIFVRESNKNRELIDRFGLPKEWLWSEVAVEAALKANDYRGNINYYLTMGDALLLKRSYRDAKEAFLRAQGINPQNAYVRQRLDLLRSMGY